MDITGPKRFIWQYSNRVKHYMKYLFLVHDEDNDNLIQVLQALSDVTGSGSMTEAQAVNALENMLFHTSNKLYRLGLNS